MAQENPIDVSTTPATMGQPDSEFYKEFIQISVLFYRGHRVLPPRVLPWSFRPTVIVSSCRRVLSSRPAEIVASGRERPAVITARRSGGQTGLTPKERWEWPDPPRLPDVRRASVDQPIERSTTKVKVISAQKCLCKLLYQVHVQKEPLMLFSWPKIKSERES